MYQIIFVILVLIVICTMYKKIYVSESFTSNGLTHYLENTTGHMCESPMDRTSSNHTLCNKLAKSSDTINTYKKFFYDATVPLSRAYGVWARGYSHGKAEGLKMHYNIDYPGNDLEFHRVWKDDCKKLANAKKNVAGYTVARRQPYCWLKSKMINRRGHGNRISYIKGNGFQFTISFWLQVTSISRYWRRILRCGGPWAGSRCPGMWIYPNGTGFHCRVSTDKSWNDGLDLRNGDISLNRWTHIAVTLKGKHIKIYKDGRLVSEKHFYGEPRFPDYMNIYGGGGGGTDSIYLSKVRFNKLCMDEHYIKDILFTDGPPPEVKLTNSNFRLAGGSRTTGRLEYKYRGKWGTVCDDIFDRNQRSAGVACRSMGFKGGKMIGNTGRLRRYRRRDYRNRRTINMDNVSCYGGEMSLEDCKSIKGPRRHNCSHYEDVVLKCY